MDLRKTRPLALILLDGWGVSPHRDGNAVALAHTPNYDALCRNFPSTTLYSGSRVGASGHEAGNAEIGHRIIGAGRAVQTDADRIAGEVASGSFLHNEVLRRAFDRASTDKKNVHLIGLLGDGGVHSSQETLFALLRMSKGAGACEVFVHGILDGRDVPPRTADVYVDALEIKMADIGIGKIASLCGRFYAMDIGENWERTARAYTMLVHGEGERGFDAVTAIRASFLRGISDEFISPIVIEEESNKPAATIGDGDLVVFFNHTAGPMRQLVRSLAVSDAASARTKIDAVCLTEYDAGFGLPVAFEKVGAGNHLAAVFVQNGVRNFRITEASRSPHVSTFLNGGADTPEELERHIFLESAGRETFESSPESKSFKIADTVIRGLDASGSGVFIVNFPAPALIAEFGNMERTVEAVQFVDTCLGGVLEKISEMNGVAVITASHGGCEDFGLNERSHLLPLHVIDPHDPELRLAPDGSLEDVAPTLLGLLGISQPPEMTGRDLRTH